MAQKLWDFGLRNCGTGRKNYGILHLTPLQARVLEAIYVDDLPAEKVARRLGVTTRAVERTRRRAETALSDLLTMDDGARLRLLK